MLISRIVCDICGSRMSEFDSFMISVDFCSAPVTFAIAVALASVQFSTGPPLGAYPHLPSYFFDSPNCCCN